LIFIVFFDSVLLLRVIKVMKQNALAERTILRCLYHKFDAQDVHGDTKKAADVVQPKALVRVS